MSFSSNFLTEGCTAVEPAQALSAVRIVNDYVQLPRMTGLTTDTCRVSLIVRLRVGSRRREKRRQIPVVLAHPHRPSLSIGETEGSFQNIPCRFCGKISRLVRRCGIVSRLLRRPLRRS